MDFPSLYLLKLDIFHGYPECLDMLDFFNAENSTDLGTRTIRAASFRRRSPALARQHAAARGQTPGSLPEKPFGGSRYAFRPSKHGGDVSQKAAPGSVGPAIIPPSPPTVRPDHSGHQILSCRTLLQKRNWKCSSSGEDAVMTFLTSYHLQRR